MSSSDPVRDLQTVELEQTPSPTTTPPANKRTWVRYAVIGGVLVGAALIAIIVVFTATPTNGQRRFTLDDVLNGKLSPQRLNGTWHSSDVLFHRNAAGDAVLSNVRTGRTTRLLTAAQLRLTAGNRTADALQLSANGRFVLAEYVQERRFRHSRRSLYRLLPVAVPETGKPGNNDDAAVFISNDGSATAIDFARFGPTGSRIVFVQSNDIYHILTASVPDRHERITSTGSPTVSNGICDWVYEEEVFSRSSALWFSPDGRWLAYAQFDDSRVHNVSMWHWGRAADGTLDTQYPTEQRIAYPKVGSPNPDVRLYVTDLDVATAVKASSLLLPVPKRLLETSKDEPMLVAVKWTNDSSVVAAWQNRQQTHAYVVLCELNGTAGNGGVAEECDQIADLQSQTGWVDLGEPLHINHPAQPLQRLALVKARNNIKRIVTYTIAAGMGIERVLNTSAINVERLVHWSSANATIFFVGNTLAAPHERHLYAVADDDNTTASTAGAQCLTCELKPSARYTHFSASFPPAADADDSVQHVILISEGPAVPRHDLYTWTRRSDGGSELKLAREWQSNAAVTAQLEDGAFAALQVRHLDPIVLAATDADGVAYEARVRLLLPAGFDEKKRSAYPLLVYVYGGPGTFAGTSAWRMGFSEFLASNRSVVVAEIDGRGTTRRDVRNLQAVYGRLGQTEVLDQIDVAGKLGRNLTFIDASRIGIWGWSYGGYAAAMSLALDTANVFRCGASVAPVTDWTLYDTIYTERYMGLLRDNADGYRNGSLLEHAEALRNKRFYLVHGTADDNVHFQQSMELAMRLERADIEFEQMSYPNEDHSLHNVLPYFYTKLTHFFDRCFQKAIK